MREKIQDHTSTHKNIKIRVTVSIDIVSIADIRKSFDSLLHAADMAMYQAKANGRNQVCSFEKEKKQNKN
jgi:diguanylate cyclase (GGDEF)-like protein